MAAWVDLAGHRFGMLTCLSYLNLRNKQSKWICRCDCGIVTHIPANNLKNGNSTSCGCYRKTRAIKHGDARSSEYNIWIAMNQRCTNPNMDIFKHYGGRGIKVCDRWDPRKTQSAYKNFLQDMGRRPTRKHTLDRVKNDESYHPGNCEWRTMPEQRLNQRPLRDGNGKMRVRWISVNGQKKCLHHWARDLEIDPNRIYELIRKGHSDEQAIRHLIQKKGAGV